MLVFNLDIEMESANIKLVKICIQIQIHIPNFAPVSKTRPKLKLEV